MFKELYQNSQKLGGGFSRILESLDDPNDINIITATGKLLNIFLNNEILGCNTNNINMLLLLLFDLL